MKSVRIGGVPFPVEELATQGDAVLGIRGSGTLNRLKLVEVYDGKFRLHHALGG